ncbi:MAG TPA: hypothetical protein VFW62_07385, partial [bacterium]|nr:hypothetical protein [bacterium]
MSRRRQKIREQFLEYFRYRTGRIVHGRNPPPASTPSEDNARAGSSIRGSVSVGSAAGSISAGFIHDQPEIRLIVRDA